jgi:hypothetical protein
MLDNKIEMLNKNNNKTNKLMKSNNNDNYVKFKLSKEKTIIFNDEKLVKIKDITDFYKILNLGCTYRMMFNIEFYNYNDSVGFVFKVQKLQIRNNENEINIVKFTD